MRFFSKLLLTLFLLNGELTLADEIQKIDPATILYTTPTIPNELPPMVEFIGDGDTKVLGIHEDAWSKIEFLHPLQLSEIQNVMKEYKAFELKNRRSVGWQNVYLRNFTHEPVFITENPKDKLLSILNSEEGNLPLIHSSSAVVGLVENGFSISIDFDIALYGYIEGMKVSALGAAIGANPDNKMLVKAFSILNKEWGVILVDWDSQFILTGIDSSGPVEIWRP